MYLQKYFSGPVRVVFEGERERGGERERQTDRQRHRQTDRQTDRQTETETHRQTDRVFLKVLLSSVCLYLL